MSCFLRGGGAFCNQSESGDFLWSVYTARSVQMMHSGMVCCVVFIVVFIVVCELGSLQTQLVVFGMLCELPLFPLFYVLLRPSAEYVHRMRSLQSTWHQMVVVVVVCT